MKKKITGMSFAILGIAFVIYNLFIFLFLKPETSVFWISYVFMVLAFGLQVLGMYLAFKDMTIEAAFFGIPLAQFTLYYFFAELFMSLVFMIFQHINWKIPVFLQILLLAVYAVVAVVSIVSRDAATAVKNDYQQKAVAQRMKTVDVEILRAGVTDPQLKEQLRRLGETVRFSDPMTNDVVADVDARIYQEMMALQTSCEDNAVAAALDSCSRLQRLYVERNRKLMASK